MQTRWFQVAAAGWIVGAAVVLCGWAAPARAQEADAGNEPQLAELLQKRGTILLRDASLADWVFAIQQEWGVNIVFTNELTRVVVNGAFTDRPLQEVLDAVLGRNGYGYQQVGNSLLIVPASQLNKVKPGMRDEVILLEYLNPTDVEASVQILLSADGMVQAIAGSKSLYVVDMPENIEKVKRHLAILEENARKIEEKKLAAEQQRREQELAERRADQLAQQQALESQLQQTREPEIAQEDWAVFPLRFISADTIEETISTVIGADGRVTALTEENKILVIAPAATVQMVSQVLAKLDQPRPQVRITALLYDVSLEDMERLGFNWTQAGKGRIDAMGDPRSLFEIDSTNFANPRAAPMMMADDAAAAVDPTLGGTGDMMASVASTPIGGLITLQHLSRHFDLTAVINAFSTLDGTRLLARPNIIAYDGVEAEFRSVSEIPVQQLTQTDDGGNIGTTEFREAGISLSVTPRINDDGSLRLQIAPEFSVLAGFQDGQPIIDRRSASTTVHMLDGSTVVIGGLLRRNELDTQRGIPGLKKMKYFGQFFRDHETTVGESELLVFVRAELVPPTYPGVPREEVAGRVTESMLESIPHASPHPITPNCGDPYCPYHNPYRHRGPGAPPPCVHAPYPVMDEGPGSLPPEQLPPAPSRPQPPARSAPAGAPTPAVPAGPSLPPAGERPVAEPASAPPPFAAPQRVTAPPPVIIDETAELRARARARLAMRRLPAPRRMPSERSTSERSTCAGTRRAPAQRDMSEVPRLGEQEGSPPATRPPRVPATTAQQRDWVQRMFRF